MESDHYQHYRDEETLDAGNSEIITTTITKRAICTTGCGRPSTTCICPFLPSTPLFNRTRLFILQHPHELRQKLATVPFLCKCLANCTTIVGRRLCLGSSSTLDSLYHRRTSSASAIFLFPGTESSPSVNLSQWVSSHETLIDDLVLIVFDGTWKHAKEMVSASLPFLSDFATQVSLDLDYGFDGESIFESDLILRKEPFLGCVSTTEAVARTLRILEPNGTEIEECLLSVLRAMVGFQASHLKPVKCRPKLYKKGKEKRRQGLLDQ